VSLLEYDYELHKSSVSSPRSSSCCCCTSQHRHGFSHSWLHSIPAICTRDCLLIASIPPTASAYLATTIAATPVAWWSFEPGPTSFISAAFLCTSVFIYIFLIATALSADAFAAVTVPSDSTSRIAKHGN